MHVVPNCMLKHWAATAFFGLALAAFLAASAPCLPCLYTTSRSQPDSSMNVTRYCHVPFSSCGFQVRCILIVDINYFIRSYICNLDHGLITVFLPYLIHRTCHCTGPQCTQPLGAAIDQDQEASPLILGSPCLHLLILSLNTLDTSSTASLH